MGNLVGVGNIGFSSASSTDDFCSQHLIFHVTHLNPRSEDGRGHGLQLRCLSE
ncbi:hypothetical protein [uncultured Rikenella sp.]|uniref:hypothetical protein n=1 Tax=uncultured Rikenella sp. TaxID=368003 RepID=UPI0025F3CFC8|nr:hypothetical protein [uncultured Rikenella sp.]